jgi:hypothetical protein
MEQRFREWQERRLARMQDEVEQLRRQAQELAAQEADAAAHDDHLLGVKAKPLVGPDGQSLAWRFRYGIAGVPGQEVPATSVNEPAAPMATAADSRSWHFTWTLLSLRPAQEPL